MDENLILYGCKLAKEMERNLPLLANQPEALLASCEEIINIFASVRERVIASQGEMMSFHGGGGIQEWLRSGGGTILTPATSGTASTPREHIDLLSAQSMLGADRNEMNGMQPTPGLDFVFGGGRDAGRVGEAQNTVNAPDFIRSSLPRRTHKRRKDEGENFVTRVAAPQMGNLDLPPEDGFTWRKYGQKEILGSKYPRSYYRCTHQRFYECPAKKQVQRLDHDPFTFEVTYRGTHTCHMSSTAPSAPAPLPEHALPAPTVAVHHPLSASLANTTHWLSMHIIQGASASSGGGAGPSAANQFPDYPLPMADMAEAMFNSGSGSSSMGLIFSTMDERWDSEARKD